MNTPRARDRFSAWLRSENDIKGHLQFIYGESGGIVLELGVRGGVSTSAFLLGVERDDGHLFSVDINPRCKNIFWGHPGWTFIESDSKDFDRIEANVLGVGHPLAFDLIFLDTTHTFEQVSQELKMWSHYLKPKGTILVHDVTKYPSGGGKACEQFAKTENWKYRVREGSNGLGILTRKEKQK